MPEIIKEGTGTCKLKPWAPPPPKQRNTLLLPLWQQVPKREKRLKPSPRINQSGLHCHHGLIWEVILEAVERAIIGSSSSMRKNRLIIAHINTCLTKLPLEHVSFCPAFILELMNIIMISLAHAKHRADSSSHELLKSGGSTIPWRMNHLHFLARFGG